MKKPLVKRATIKDVANHAGVSTATVSRIVNGHESVGVKVRDQVQR